MLLARIEGAHKLWILAARACSAGSLLFLRVLLMNGEMGYTLSMIQRWVSLFWRPRVTTL